MKKTNMIKRVLCLVLCIAMGAATLLSLTSCDVEEVTGNEDIITVVRVKKDIESGKKLTADMFETVKILQTEVPLNAIRDIRKIEGKYNTQKLYAGEYVFKGKLSESAPTEATEYESNVVVTDKINTNGDISTEIQKVIDSNPGRTIEFPDGEYVLSKPIKVYADPDKAVSLRLSEFAVIKAADNWNSADAMFCLSVGDIPKGKDLKNTFYLTGGIFDGNGKATAVSVGNGENLMIIGVDFKNVVTAIDVKGGIVDVENVDIVGAGDNSVGMKIAGEYSTYTNVRISNVATAVSVSGDNNVFKSVYATCDNTNNQKRAFVDNSVKGNTYDMCVSENFSVGFEMGTCVSVYSVCYVKWESDAIKNQIGFRSTAKFNSVIRNSKVEFDFAGCGGSYLTDTTTGGDGQVLWPMIGGKNNMVDTSYTAYLKGTTAVAK